MKTDIYFWSYLAQFFLEWKMFQIKVLEKFWTHILYSVTFFLKLCRLWDNLEKTFVERGKPQKTIWRMRIACWIPKATNTHTGCVILIDFSTTTMVVRTRLIGALYVHCLSCSWMFKSHKKRHVSCIYYKYPTRSVSVRHLQANVYHRLS